MKKSLETAWVNLWGYICHLNLVPTSMCKTKECFSCFNPLAQIVMQKLPVGERFSSRDHPPNMGFSYCAVMKPNAEVNICVDYKYNSNKETQHY